MSIFQFENIKILCVEITTVCNAKCGACPRKNLSSYQHMSKDIWLQVISEENLKNIEQIFFNGNYGDFSCHPNSLDFLNEITNKNIDIVISTNGSTHNKEYWSNLALVLKKFRNHKVIFALDGATEETHSSYRENTKFFKILDNVNSFILNGGNASWQFITFKENQHEIETAFNLAKDLKFKEFFLLNSYSSIVNSQGKTLNPLNSTEYLQYLIKYTFKLHTVKELSKGYNSNCPWTSLRRIKIDVDGLIWPCCWTSEIFSNILEINLNKIPTLKDNTLKEIIESEFYQVYMTDKVNDKNSYCNLQCPAKTKDVKFLYKSMG